MLASYTNKPCPHHDMNCSIVMDKQSDSMWYFDRSNHTSEIFSKEYYRVNPGNEKLIITFEAMSVGKVLSRTYFAIKCFTEDKTYIDAMTGGFVFSGNLIVEDVLSDNSLKLSGSNEQFLKFSGEFRQFAIAIFCDGNTNKYADHLFKYEKDKPLFEFADNILTLLNHTIPDWLICEIQKNTTVVRLHHDSGYVYPLGAFYVPKDKFTTYTAIVSTVGQFSGCDETLRMGTRYIKIGFLPNYHQSDNPKLIIRNFSMSLIDIDLCGNNNDDGTITIPPMPRIILECSLSKYREMEGTISKLLLENNELKKVIEGMEILEKDSCEETNDDIISVLSSENTELKKIIVEMREKAKQMMNNFIHGTVSLDPIFCVQK